MLMTLFAATILAGALAGSAMAQAPDAGCALPSEPEGIPAAIDAAIHRACGQGSSLHEGPVNTRSALHVRFPTPQRTCVTSAMAPPRCVLWNFATNAARANHEQNEIRGQVG